MTLFLLFYVFIAPTVTGILIVAVLTMPDYTSNSLIIAAVTGFFVAAPVAWVISKNIGNKSAS